MRFVNVMLFFFWFVRFFVVESQYYPPLRCSFALRWAVIFAHATSGTCRVERLDVGFKLFFDRSKAARGVVRDLPAYRYF